ncbi:polynucleotide kinase 3-phosphatase-like [Geitlerinema sp. FC II]|nr:polynucleotide kinase 3-phosphatase-like [Geitlerinema sp. FC II]
MFLCLFDKNKNVNIDFYLSIQPTKNKIKSIIFAGIKGSGKSTFYFQYFANTHLRINLDMLKTRHREKLIFEACLYAKQPLVIDNTNPTKLDRARYISPESLQIQRYRLLLRVFLARMLTSQQPTQRKSKNSRNRRAIDL